MSNNTPVTLFHIGTQKAASTFLYNLLREHPEACLHQETEVNFFTTHFEKGEEWYHNGFKGGGKRIDTSPKYFMLGQTAALRIYDYCQKYGVVPRFLLILRNPIDYLFSHFQMHRRHRFFEKNPNQYPEVTDNLLKHLEMYPAYLDRAFYARLLREQWFKHFDLKQFKVITFEKFVRHNQPAMVEILRFWGLSPRELKTGIASKNKMLRFRFLLKWQARVMQNRQLKEKLKHSQTFNFIYDKFLTMRSNKQLSPEERGFIKNIYAQDVNELKQLTGLSFEEWIEFR